MSVIAKCVNALKELQELTREAFAEDEIAQAAVERNFQVAIQAALDIGSMLLATLSTDVPREYREIFPGLADVGVLPSEFAEKLSGMAGFRNILVHLYLDLDLERMYEYLQCNLGDFELFAQYVGEYLAHLEASEEV